MFPLRTKEDRDIQPLKDVPIETVRVLACCHSLTHIDDNVVGDPVEKAALSAIDWTLTKGDVFFITVCHSIRVLDKISPRIKDPDGVF